ncbi:phosphoribosylanthranilate isomerase [Adhaeribacter pallidiroseus]|uniref:N-(5'-phosphoribosyl)anthranilate isomerase n=1 Tax=Adhaeribacter pallidiroseus TaxID=2072847 RepID=A0A369QKP1_9BACT|nr:phosphoribosylanthranilate isomerase [Adhaeribacter pallidiroseus]RDC64900.1 Phosphoribosylanthranilate isomerase [Adhaeribacter pallidiroseus]
MTAIPVSTFLKTEPTTLQVKVCGMREPENIGALVALQPDYIGFIFYRKSARYAGEKLNPEYIKHLPATVQKVGVFVDESLENIRTLTKKFCLQAVQLHGHETPEFCSQLKQAGFLVLKAFALDDAFDFKILEPYEGTCDYYLFDTKGQQHGGNGITFNWDILEQYHLNTPFFLSGGLDLEHAPAIKAGRWPQLRGIDINSRFELEPGLKNISKVKKMLKAFR